MNITIHCYPLQTLSSVKPMPDNLRYTITYRRVYDSQAGSDINTIWWNARQNIASSLNIPPKQVHGLVFLLTVQFGMLGSQDKEIKLIR